MRYVSILLVGLAAVSCDGSSRPTPFSPEATTAPIPPSGPTPGTPAAVLEVMTFNVRQIALASGSSHFQYEVTLQLAETTGTSGADLISVWLTDSRGNIGYGCPSPGLARIGPGGKWAMSSLGYCAPDVPTDADVSMVSFGVRFADDVGRVGQLDATTSVTK